MNAYEPIGYLAALLVLATFCMSGMVALRAVAIASNVVFLGYAALTGISPVLLLHALLLPMNVYRLLQIVREPGHRRQYYGRDLACKCPLTSRVRDLADRDRTLPVAMAFAPAHQDDASSLCNARYQRPGS